jgi:hypothetical protein
MTESIEQITLNTWRDLCQEAKDSALYRQLITRRYRNPAGYLTWEEVAGKIAGFNRLANIMPEPLRDWTVQASIMLGLEIAQYKAPCYWLSKPLAEALINTDLPPVSDLRKIVPAGVFMFPKELFRNPDGFPVDWVGVMQMDYEQFAPRYQEVYGTLPNGGSRVAWSHVLPNGISYAQSIGIVPEQPEPELGTFDIQNPFHSLDPISQDAEGEFSRSISSLVLKCLLIMQSRPELLEVEQQAAVTTLQNASRRKRTPDGLLSPNWIGKHYQPKRESQLRGGTHASPMMHWRRGHLKRVAIGEGRRDRKWVWIEPTLVMGGSDRP